MSAEQRFQYSEFAVERFVEILDERGVAYGLSGREHLRSTAAFQTLLNKLSDSTSQFVRFFPDVITSTDQGSAFVEVKRGRSIERDAYLAYRLLQDSMECKVFIAILHGDSFYIGGIDGLRFKPARRKNMPVFDGCWIAPREFDDRWTKEMYMGWKKAHPNASGTTFAYIDFDATEWKRII